MRSRPPDDRRLERFVPAVAIVGEDAGFQLPALAANPIQLGRVDDHRVGELERQPLTDDLADLVLTQRGPEGSLGPPLQRPLPTHHDPGVRKRETELLRSGAAVAVRAVAKHNGVVLARFEEAVEPVARREVAR